MAKNKRKEPQLPTRFEERYTELFGSYVYGSIEKTFIKRPVSFRVNTLKCTRAEILDVLRNLGFKVKPVSWFTNAFILQNKSQKELESLEIYVKGKIYLQSLASMVPPVVLAPNPGEKVLDLTAAPGGKTSQMAAIMNGVGELVANDNNEIRFQKLEHNMQLLGVTEKRADWNFTLHQDRGLDLAKKYPLFFDKILLDAPCTAEARIVLAERRTFAFWDERNIKETSYRQRQLLFAAWSALKPGGFLVYSTCTFAPEENEVQIFKLLEDLPDAAVEEVKISNLQTVQPVVEWKGVRLNKQIKKCLRLMPTNEVEGFFMCKIKKQKYDK